MVDFCHNAYTFPYLDLDSDSIHVLAFSIVVYGLTVWILDLNW
jgi:hypothetical protein